MKKDFDAIYEDFLDKIIDAHYKISYEIDKRNKGDIIGLEQILVSFFNDNSSWNNFFEQNKLISQKMLRAVNDLYFLLFNKLLDPKKIISLPMTRKSFNIETEKITKKIKQLEKEHKIFFKDYLKYKMGLSKYKTDKFESFDIMLKLID